MIHCRLFFIVLVAAAQSDSAQTETVFPGEAWQTRSPQEAGLDPEKLDAFAKAVGGDGVVIRDGYLVKTWGRPERRADWASSGKPVISSLLLFAVQEGKLKSVDDPVWPWVKKRWPERDLIEKDRSMTFRHLADMTSGYGRAELPGTHWAYNDYGIRLYAEVLTEVLGSSLNDAALSRLKPLQFQDGDVFGSRGGAGINTSPRDFARIGWWWLNRGRWGDEQLLPEKVFEQFCRPDVAADLARTKLAGSDYLKIGTHGGGTDQDFPGQGVYGFNLWFNSRMGTSEERFQPSLPPDSYFAIGHRGKEVMVIIPSHRIVAAARGDWGDVRLAKTKLLAEAIGIENETRH